MLVVVTLISLLVHVFSTDYVAGDRRYTHYFAFLSLFTASMLFFVLSENTLQMIVGWELVGLCSFALIGHWWEEKPNSDAALKAFLTNRVGDIGLLCRHDHPVLRRRWHLRHDRHQHHGQRRRDQHFLLLVASLSLITAVMSKSGQFILHTWLPDAMAGPTPVSALIHAATMVVAGIYMVARLYGVFFNGLSIGTGLQPHRPRRRVVTPCSPPPRLRAERHQEGAGLLHGQPARLHGPGPRCRAPGPPPSSTSSPTPSSRPACSSAPARWPTTSTPST
jgi:NADH-quinone oxidoreductase subunit L